MANFSSKDWLIDREPGSTAPEPAPPPRSGHGESQTPKSCSRREIAYAAPGKSCRALEACRGTSGMNNTKLAGLVGNRACTVLQFASPFLPIVVLFCVYPIPPITDVIPHIAFTLMPTFAPDDFYITTSGITYRTFDLTARLLHWIVGADLHRICAAVMLLTYGLLCSAPVLFVYFSRPRALTFRALPRWSCFSNDAFPLLRLGGLSLHLLGLALRTSRTCLPPSRPRSAHQGPRASLVSPLLSPPHPGALRPSPRLLLLRARPLLYGRPSRFQPPLP